MLGEFHSFEAQCELGVNSFRIMAGPHRLNSGCRNQVDRILLGCQIRRPLQLECCTICHPFIRRSFQRSSLLPSATPARWRPQRATLFSRRLVFSPTVRKAINPFTTRSLLLFPEPPWLLFFKTPQGQMPDTPSMQVYTQEVL